MGHIGVTSSWMILLQAWTFAWAFSWMWTWGNPNNVFPVVEARPRNRHINVHSTITAGFVNCRSVSDVLFVSPLEDHGHRHGHCHGQRHGQQRHVYAALSNNPNNNENDNNNNNNECSMRVRVESSQSEDRRRVIQNLFLLSSITTLNSPATATAAHAFSFGGGMNNSGEPKEVKPTIALDKMGNPIKATKPYVSKQQQMNNGDLTIMIQGLKGDPTYLILKQQGDTGGTGGIESYALNAECTHLGCIVPYDALQKKFICPCHGSQYDSLGNVLRGPAPGPLKLAKVLIQEEEEDDTVDASTRSGSSGGNGGGNVLLLPWVEDDFRTGEKPWWI